MYRYLPREVYWSTFNMLDRRFLKPKAAGFGWRHANLNLFLKEKRFSFSFATKAAPSVVSERVDCWLPHRPPANIAHHDRLSTLMSHCGCAVIFQDSLWNLREVIRSGWPCFPLKRWLYGTPCGQRHLLCHPITLWKIYSSQSTRWKRAFHK